MYSAEWKKPQYIAPWNHLRLSTNVLWWTCLMQFLVSMHCLLVTGKCIFSWVLLFQSGLSCCTLCSILNFFCLDSRHTSSSMGRGFWSFRPGRVYGGWWRPKRRCVSCALSYVFRNYFHSQVFITLSPFCCCRTSSQWCPQLWRRHVSFWCRNWTVLFFNKQQCVPEAAELWGWQISITVPISSENPRCQDCPEFGETASDHQGSGSQSTPPQESLWLQLQALWTSKNNSFWETSCFGSLLVAQEPWKAVGVHCKCSQCLWTQKKVCCKRIEGRKMLEQDLLSHH